MNSSNNGVIVVNHLAHDKVVFRKSAFDLNDAVRASLDADFIVANKVST